MRYLLFVVFLVCGCERSDYLVVQLGYKSSDCWRASARWNSDFAVGSMRQITMSQPLRWVKVRQDDWKGAAIELGVPLSKCFDMRTQR